MLMIYQPWLIEPNGKYGWLYMGKREEVISLRFYFLFIFRSCRFSSLVLPDFPEIAICFLIWSDRCKSS